MNNIPPGVIEQLQALAVQHNLDFDDLLVKFQAAMDNDVDALAKLAQAKQERHPWRKLRKDKAYYRQDLRLANSILVGKS